MLLPIKFFFQTRLTVINRLVNSKMIEIRPRILFFVTISTGFKIAIFFWFIILFFPCEFRHCHTLWWLSGSWSWIGWHWIVAKNAFFTVTNIIIKKNAIYRIWIIYLRVLPFICTIVIVQSLTICKQGGNSWRVIWR